MSSEEVALCEETPEFDEDGDLVLTRLPEKHCKKQDDVVLYIGNDITSAAILVDPLPLSHTHNF